MSFEIKHLAGGVGAEVSGLTIDGPIDASTQERLNALWLDVGILVFKGLGVSPEAQLHLSRVFGTLEVHPIESIRVDEYPELIWLSNKGRKMASVYYYDDEPVIGRIPWHTDLVYTTTPCRGALLRMIEKPDLGGETGWIDTAMAYDALPDELKTRIEGLQALFQFILEPGEMRFGRPHNVRKEMEGEGARQDIAFPEFEDVVHPIVWTHPVSGRKALNVSPLHIRHLVGMENEEGDDLLKSLVDHATQKKFTYFHDWAPNDMVLWDNWRTMHCAQGNPPEETRLVHRTTLHGDHAFGRVA